MPRLRSPDLSDFQSDLYFNGLNDRIDFESAENSKDQDFRKVAAAKLRQMLRSKTNLKQRPTKKDPSYSLRAGK